MEVGHHGSMEIVRYGDAPSQYAELHSPAGAAGAAGLPVVVLVHGGFWRAAYDLTLMHPLSADLAERGYAAWNVEYRRVGEPGGGWTGTFQDVAAAVDRLADVFPAYGLDTGRIAVVGHSAGGHLALWCAARHRLPPQAPGAPARIRPRAVVSQAGVADLRSADAEGLGEHAVEALLGGHAGEVSDRYAVTSPRDLLPLGVPQLLVHGDADDRVPLAQSREYAAAARASGDRVELVEVRGADHFDVIAPAHEAWTTVVDRLPALL